MPTLSLVNNFQLNSQGALKTGKQGLATGGFSDEFDITTVTGTNLQLTGTLATATVNTIFDSDDFPQTWVYLHYWADVVTYLQVIGSGTNAIFKVAALEPFVIPGYNKILAAADTTLIAGGAEPSLTTISKIVIGNYSGGPANYTFAVVN